MKLKTIEPDHIDMFEVSELQQKYGLSPILIVLRDRAPGVGSIEATCSRLRWKAEWSGMGERSVAQFVAEESAQYLAENFARGIAPNDPRIVLKATMHQFAAAVRAAVRTRLKEGARLPPWAQPTRAAIAQAAKPLSEEQPAELEEARKLELLSAMKPFAELVLATSGRIPHERLSFANWHDLTRAYKKHRDA